MKVAFVQTGGTIDKDYPKTIRGCGFEISDKPAFEKILTKLNPSVSFEFTYVSAFRKDSQYISDEDRFRLGRKLLSITESRIIVTHGTDTLIDTAKCLEKRIVAEGKVVILTGSFLPERFKDSDAEFNLGVAVGAIQVLPDPGVYVAMSGLVLPASKASRDSEGRFLSL